MARCEMCKTKIPRRFLAPLFSNGAYSLVDPECALKVQGSDRFHGEIFQQMLEDFREWKLTLNKEK
jgi:hypothetical protein